MEIRGEVPWKHPARFWRDADDAQLINYVDARYGDHQSLAAACFTCGQPRLICRRNLLALLAGGVLCMGGYYLAEVILTGNWAGPLVSVGANGIQALGSAVLYLIMAAALDRSHLKARLFSAR